MTLISKNPTTPRQRDTVQALLLTINDASDFLDRYKRSNISALAGDDANWDLIRQRAKEVLEVFAPLPYE